MFCYFTFSYTENSKSSHEQPPSTWVGTIRYLLISEMTNLKQSRNLCHCLFTYFRLSTHSNPILWLERFCENNCLKDDLLQAWFNHMIIWIHLERVLGKVPSHMKWSVPEPEAWILTSVSAYLVIVTASLITSPVAKPKYWLKILP